MYLPEAKHDIFWAVVGSPWSWLVAWLVLMNLTAFLAFGLDKWKAKRKETHEKTRRIPEKTLFLLAILDYYLVMFLLVLVLHILDL